MIRLDRLKKSDVGRIVVYHPPHGQNDEGRLVSWNELYAFVKFRGPNGEACLPAWVSFASYGDKQ